MCDELRMFYENLSSKTIIIKDVRVDEFLGQYQVRMNIEIPRLQLRFSYGNSIPFKIKNLKDKNLKKMIINTMKIDINEYIVKLIKLNEIGE